MARISDNLQYLRVNQAHHCSSQSLAHMPKNVFAITPGMIPS